MPARTIAVVPARSGSKGVPDKNIRKIAGKHLIGYAIEFALRLRQVDGVICSTDAEHYAEVARRYGADVPFLRSAESAGDAAMEEDVLREMHQGFVNNDIDVPDLIVWLRPTFPFRPIESVERCIQRMRADGTMTACRVVTPADARTYVDAGGFLRPGFDDGGRSMVRRQDMPAAYHAFNTDVFRFPVPGSGDAFLGDRVGFEVAPRVCGLDIDDEVDFRIAAALIENARDLVDDYLPRHRSDRRDP